MEKVDELEIADQVTEASETVGDLSLEGGSETLVFDEVVGELMEELVWNTLYDAQGDDSGRKKDVALVLDIPPVSWEWIDSEVIRAGLSADCGESEGNWGSAGMWPELWNPGLLSRLRTDVDCNSLVCWQTGAPNADYLALEDCLLEDLVVSLMVEEAQRCLLIDCTGEMRSADGLWVERERGGGICVKQVKRPLGLLQWMSGVDAEMLREVVPETGGEVSRGTQIVEPGSDERCCP